MDKPRGIYPATAQHVFDEEICKVLSGRVAFVVDCE
jgi:hypothetical protein